MSAPNVAAFSGDIPAKYDSGLGPVLMVPFAKDLASRVDPGLEGEILELAAGTGILTEQLATENATRKIVATDLNQGMLDILVQRCKGKNVTARTADACALPFQDAIYSTVLSQFGVMFFPDKVASFRETHRVLQPGGKYVFNVWDSLEHNDFARCINDLLQEKFGAQAPKFYETPFGFHDTALMESQLKEAGFSAVRAERVAKECTGPSVSIFSDGVILGNPIIMELQNLGESAASETQSDFCEKFSSQYGDAPFKSNMQAIVFEATK